MSAIEIRDSNGIVKTLSREQIEALSTATRGPLLRADDEGYDESRTIWNAMIDRRPALIVRCTGTGDVIHAVKFAREHGLLVAVHGGGHNIAGNAVCDGGLMIDLSSMRQVTVDPETRAVHVGPGATLGDLDHETQAFGLAVPVGINSTTGVAGLTLGGGFGWLSRKHGLTIDTLVAADVVTADGSFVRASERENADLFWAIRGGGGNFGVVTLFEFRAHPVGPNVVAGLVVFPLDQAKSVLEQYREFVKTLPPEGNIWIVLRKAPPLPFLPEEVHGKEVLVLAVFYSGDPAQGQKILEPVQGFGTPVGVHVGEQPFTAWQQAFDPLLAPGARNYWKSHNFTELSDGIIDTALKYAAELPSPQCEVFVGMLGGATSAVASDATAYEGRNAEFVMNVHGRWETPREDGACIGWCRRIFDEAAPYATGGAYVNFMTEDETERVGAAYGANYERLAKIKAKYDPTNLFRLNHNVVPAS
jgi:FAD/FMN-containing dehydrogenase